MNAKAIKSKQINTSLDQKYLMAKMDKPVVHSGETVEDFIKRGGTIKKSGRIIKVPNASINA